MVLGRTLERKKMIKKKQLFKSLKMGFEPFKVKIHLIFIRK